jgi:hypothetical protein
MRKFGYYQPDSPHMIIVNEDEIVNGLWGNFWKKRMIEKFGHDHPLITDETCIYDFYVIHMAEEI